MITRLEIDGFKSFEDFAIDLTPFHVIIGTNASGKSNLCDAMVFFSEILASKDLDPYVGLRAIRGDAAGIFRQRGDGTRVDRIRIVAETISVLEGERHHHNVELIVDWIEDDAKQRVLRASIGVDTGAPRDLLAMWPYFRVFQWEDKALRRPSPLDEPVGLGADGTGLPGYLRRLRLTTKSDESPDGVLADIRVDLANIVREVFGFDVVDDARRRDVRIEFTDRNGPAFGAEFASAGTLRVLATVAALNNPAAIARALVFEEPENGVYPERLRDLLRTMRDLTDDELDQNAPFRQVIITSHSPVILDVVPRREITLLDTVTHVQDGVSSRIARARSLEPSSAERPPGAPVLTVTESELEEFRAGREAAVP